MTDAELTGGCQCGAVRFRAASLGRASICHCRMCQKAFGSFFGPFVTAHGVVWTRGGPKRFKSSNVVHRGFCADCGTPLTYEYEGGTELAIGAFDDPSVASPEIQTNPTDKLTFFDTLHELPMKPASASAEFNRTVVSYQHPDRDTDHWPPEALS